MQSQNRSLGMLSRLAVASAALLIALAVGIAVANAAEVIPAAGLSRTVDADDAVLFGSLSVRGQMHPLLASELGVAYREESGDAVQMRMWPVTASLWFTPVPALYAGAGVGWYNISFDYADDLVPPVESHTEQEFGVHVGGGARVPLTQAASIDLNGRYVMMREMDAVLVPESFDPDFWQLALGLGFKF